MNEGERLLELYDELKDKDTELAKKDAEIAELKRKIAEFIDGESDK